MVYLSGAEKTSKMYYNMSLLRSSNILSYYLQILSSKYLHNTIYTLKH